MDIQVKVGVLIADKDKILLQKEWSEAKKGYFWNFVKGTFDSSIDKTVFECAKREAKEEVGVDIELKSLINVVVKHGSLGTRIYFNFVGEILKGEPKMAPLEEQRERKEDTKEIRWTSKDDITKFSKEDFISDVVYQAILNWTKGKLYPLELLEDIFLK